MVAGAAPKGRARGKSGLHRARVPGNTRWRRLQGKCNRNKPLRVYLSKGGKVR